MSDVQLTLTIPEDVAKTAQEFGLLTPQSVASLLVAEIERKAAQLSPDDLYAMSDEQRERLRDVAAQRARDMVAKLDALEPKLSQEEIDQAMKSN
jgi:hypothetical protein